MMGCSLRIMALAAAALWLGTGCAKKKRAHLENEDPAPAGSAEVKTALDRFPLDPAVLGSKSYPLKTISTTNLAGRIKEGAASTWPFTLVDARSRVEYENEHITGSINVPAEKIETALPVAVRERERQVLFYCNGPACTKSHKAGRAAISAGYRDVGIYDEGMPAWKEAGCPSRVTRFRRWSSSRSLRRRCATRSARRASSSSTFGPATSFSRSGSVGHSTWSSTTSRRSSAPR